VGGINNAGIPKSLPLISWPGGYRALFFRPDTPNNDALAWKYEKYKKLKDC
jgi:hypothetical protein